MTGLIKKQLFSTRIYALIFAICSLLYIGMYLFIKEVLFHSLVEDTTFSRTALSVMPLIIVMEFNCKNFKFDNEMPGTEKYFNSLPVSRLQVVLSKFISSISFTFLGLIMSFAAITCFTLSDGAAINSLPYKRIFIIFLCAVIFFTLQFPILVYNGNELLSLMLPLTCIVTFVVIASIVTDKSINELISSASKWINGHNLTNTKLILIILPILLIFICSSIFISYKIYKRREF